MIMASGMGSRFILLGRCVMREEQKFSVGYLFSFDGSGDGNGYGYKESGYGHGAECALTTGKGLGNRRCYFAWSLTNERL